MSNEPIDEEIQELTGKVLDALTPKQPQPSEQRAFTVDNRGYFHFDQKRFTRDYSPALKKYLGVPAKPASQSASEPEQWLTEINNYLQHGGLFNPELATHENVRDLLRSIRDGLSDHIGKVKAKDALLREAIDRIKDMYAGDDGQAWKEARKFLAKLEESK